MWADTTGEPPATDPTCGRTCGAVGFRQSENVNCRSRALEDPDMLVIGRWDGDRTITTRASHRTNRSRTSRCDHSGCAALIGADMRSFDSSPTT